MNTMLMTVFERKREICILLAIGWKPGRVIRMILYESALLGFLGGIVGGAVGTLAAQLLKALPAIHGMLEPDLNLELMAVAVALAVAVGVLSGLYPHGAAPAWHQASPCRADCFSNQGRE